MKKPICLLLALMLLSSLIPWTGSDASAEAGEVTILVYVCGSDLESESGEASDDIREMASSGVGSSASVQVLLATGGTTRWNGYNFSSRTVQYSRIDRNGPVLMKDAGRVSMGDPKTLSDFLQFGLSAAPAQRTILVLWDHGGGPVYGLCNDENYQDDGLSLDELKNALTDGLQGKQLDIIAFDCCLMNCVDLCYDLYGIADYSVVSQELVSGTGLNYDEWIKPIVQNPEISPEKIARLMADTYVTENANGRDATTATMTVVASERMPDVMEAADAFSASLTALMKTDLAGVVRARNKLTSFGEFLDYDASDLVDVSDMCDAFSTLLPQESALLKQSTEQAVCYNCTTRDIAGYAHGMSFFLPYKTVSTDQKEILSHYHDQSSSYAALATTMTSQVMSSGYAMTAASYMPDNFYSANNGSCSGSFCDIWNGYYGDSCSFDDVYNACEGNIWAGLNIENGSIWEGYSSSSGIWSGYEPDQPEVTPSTSIGGIWAGLETETETPASSEEAAAALGNIWAGFLNQGTDYYQPGEENQNLLTGVSEAVPVGELLETAGSYFANASLTAQMVYSLQLTKEDLNHLSTASGVLSQQVGDETIRFGNMGQTTIDWSTGLIISMFDGSWPMLGGQMVRAEYFYGDEEGNVRFVIPARINGLKMYLLGNYSKDGKTQLLGATQGYDEKGYAIRGYIPLEAGTTVYPLFTAVAADGSEREYEGHAFTLSAEGTELTWNRIPEGDYAYCFSLTDLSGHVHYTESIPLGL